MDIESLRGFDFDLPAILRLFDPKKVIQTIGLEKAIQTIGLEEVIQTIGLEKIIHSLGPEDLAKTISSSLNDEEREKFIERMRQLGGDGKKVEGE